MRLLELCDVLVHRACKCIPTVPSRIFRKSGSEMMAVVKEVNDGVTFVGLTIGQRCTLVAYGNSESRCLWSPYHMYFFNCGSYQHLQIRSFYVYKRHMSASPENPEKNLASLDPHSFRAIRYHLRSKWLTLSDGTYTPRVLLLGPFFYFYYLWGRAVVQE